LAGSILKGSPVTASQITNLMSQQRQHNSLITSLKHLNIRYRYLSEQWSSGDSLQGAVVAHCETAVQSSNPAISTTYSGLPVLRWAAIWDVTSLQASEGWQRRK
jgi:hypothetical protein